MDSEVLMSVGPLAILTVPFIFTQDGLLGTGAFVKEARRRGIVVSFRELSALHQADLLAPLYSVVDDEDQAFRINVQRVSTFNERGWTLTAASRGRVRDGAGVAADWSAPEFERPADADPRHWWNGYTYSPWQLLDLRYALNGYEVVKRGHDDGALIEQAHEARALVCALAVLSPRYLPGILGMVRQPHDVDGKALWQFRRAKNTRQLLDAAGFDPHQLRSRAEWFLADAHSRDPLADWLPLVRHAGHKGWLKLKGEALDCMWARIAGEILLRAHEDLAIEGMVDPLSAYYLKCAGRYGVMCTGGQATVGCSSRVASRFLRR